MKIHHAVPAGTLALALLAGCDNSPGDGRPAAPAPTGAAVAAAPQSAAPAARPSMGKLVTSVDGQRSEWQILAGVPGDDLRRPSATVASQGPMMLLSLQGTAAEDRSRQAALSATLMSQGNDYTVTSHDLFLYPEGAGGPLLEAQELEIEWSRIELDSQGGHVAGRFSGSLCPDGSATGIDEGCSSLEGSFESEVASDKVLQDILDGSSGGRP